MMKQYRISVSRKAVGEVEKMDARYAPEFRKFVEHLWNTPDTYEMCVLLYNNSTLYEVNSLFGGVAIIEFEGSE